RQAVIAQRRSELDLARQQLADTAILSPLDAAVSLKQASVGEYLTAGAPIATLVRMHPLRLRVPVPEREGAGVRAGHAVTLTVPASSVIVFAGVEKVLVVRQGKTAEVRVTTGRRFGEDVEIVDGLKRGEVVVARPGNLTGGQPVKVTP